MVSIGGGGEERERTVCVNPKKLLAGTCVVAIKTPVRGCTILPLMVIDNVSWVRRRGEELHLLTIGLDTYASDSRFSLAFEKPNDWRLLLRSATERDAGLYECQVSAHPPLIRTVHLAVSVPKVEIVDEHGATAGDKFYKAGSTIELKCVVSNIPQPTGYVTWRHGSRTLNYDTTRGGIRNCQTEKSTVAFFLDVSGALQLRRLSNWHARITATADAVASSRLLNSSFLPASCRTVAVKTDMGAAGAVSRLYIANANKKDSGNYSCALANVAAATIVSVHVLNGENPAAMQHGGTTAPRATFIFTVVVSLSSLLR
ncbi:Opioid-binding protein/cell adhesion molecule [Atta colombica]|uniref:Opioid-binding protein/cell adhesion molecule n=1 Tax=Atta colombica TaxID=520822 RepID=A0A195BEH5_9HYME|nr:Opioid-binding protein/cell adhesion molecule [Atta colombica]